MIYDVVVIGGGIAGLNAAFFLNLGGAKVAIISNEEIMCGASGAAGAFIHPTMGKSSIIKDYNDKAFLTAIDFYTKYCNFNQSGAWIGPKNEKNTDKFLALEQYLPSKYKYVIHTDEFNIDNCGAYFIENAGRIPPSQIAKCIVPKIDKIYYSEAKTIEKKDDFWCINKEINTKNIIFACGAQKCEFLPKHLQIAHRGVWGQKIVIKSQRQPKHSISTRDVLMSEGFDGNLMAIGATHIPSEKQLEITQEISEQLINKAKIHFDFGETYIVKQQGGLRSASTDYLPIVGRIYDEQLALKNYPNLKDGFVPKNLPSLDGLFVHYGHGSRAFTSSVFSSKMLAELVLNKKELEANLDTKRLLIRYARKYATI